MNTIIINYPCLLCHKTWKQYHWKYMSSINFPFCLPVYLWVTHNHWAHCCATTSHTQIMSLNWLYECSLFLPSQVPTAHTGLEPQTQHSGLAGPYLNNVLPLTSHPLLCCVPLVKSTTLSLFTCLWFQHPLNDTILHSSRSKFTLFSSQHCFWKLDCVASSAYSLLDTL
jgi:hypothetical protein